MRRPSLERVDGGWRELRHGLWERQGWTVSEELVESCVPRSRSQDTLYRVRRPGISKHCGTFTLKQRAQSWVDRQISSKQRG